MAAAQKAETMEVLQAAYKRACEELNEEDAAAFARKIRDKLLNETDSRVALDRFNISVPSGTSDFLSSVIAFIKWMLYRVFPTTALYILSTANTSTANNTSAKRA